MRINFSVPLHATNLEPLINFHLSLPMGYVKNSPYFHCSSETVTNLYNIIGSESDGFIWHVLDSTVYTQPHVTYDVYYGLSSHSLYASLSSLTKYLLP